MDQQQPKTTESEATAAVIARLTAAAAAKPQTVPDHIHQPFLVLPDGHRVHSLEELEREAPDRIRAKVAFHDVASLVRYVERFVATGTLAVFASPDSRRPMVAVLLDYHADADTPSFCTHRASLLFQSTKEWQDWFDQSGKPLGQVDFARFIESHQTDITAPDGAALLEVVKSMESKKSVQFKSSVRLDNGEHQFQYDEEIKTTAGGTTAKRGTMEVPQKFKLGLRIWKGQALRWEIDALLRYRISDQGQLALWFELVRPEDVIEAAFEKVILELREKWPEQFFLGGFEG